MNTHKNARLTFARRLEMVQDITQRGLSQAAAAVAQGVSVPTARKWLGRYLADGEAALRDRSSRPRLSPRAIAPATALAIVEVAAAPAHPGAHRSSLGVSKSTVSRVLARAGLSQLRDLEPIEPVVRYEHAAAGDLLHIDIKKLGRIERPSHRVTGNRRDSVDGAGWEFLFVAVDDHARIGFTDVYPDETKASAGQFLRNAVAYYNRLACSQGVADRQRLGVPLQRLRSSLHRPRRQTSLHPPLPAPDQRQGRALHPVGAARMGLRLRLPELTPAHRPPSMPGSITTTGTARIKASAASHPCPDSERQETTS